MSITVTKGYVETSWADLCAGAVRRELDAVNNEIGGARARLDVEGVAERMMTARYAELYSYDQCMARDFAEAYDGRDFGSRAEADAAIQKDIRTAALIHWQSDWQPICDRGDFYERFYPCMLDVTDPDNAPHIPGCCAIDC